MSQAAGKVFGASKGCCQNITVKGTCRGRSAATGSIDASGKGHAEAVATN